MFAAQDTLHDDGLHRELLPPLRRLGASLGVNYCRHDAHQGGVQEVQAVFVSCARTAWVEQFGEPQHVSSYYDPDGRRWLQGWVHCLPQGPIHCLGCFFNRTPSEEWIIVKQVSRVQGEQGACGALTTDESLPGVTAGAAAQNNVHQTGCPLIE